MILPATTHTTGRPSEAQHWYTKDGKPAYEVQAANGTMRPTTLRDARKLGLLPSVTTIIRTAAAPGLERWKQEQVLLAALTLPAQASDETTAAYTARIIRDSQEQGKKAAERGTAIHAAVQGAYEGAQPSVEYTAHVTATMSKVKEVYGRTARWQAESSFAHPSGFGGKVDLNCPGVVIDFKTKEFGADSTKRLAWDEHRMQLAACRKGLGMPTAHCANVFISVSEPGLVVVHVWPEDELQEAWRMFAALLAYWQAKNSHNPTGETV